MLIKNLFARTVDIKKKERSRSMRGFFGLNEEYMESVYEHFFYLVKHGNWSFFEAYALPIGLRKWFVDKLSDFYKKREEALNS